MDSSSLNIILGEGNEVPDDVLRSFITQVLAEDETTQETAQVLADESSFLPVFRKSNISNNNQTAVELLGEARFNDEEEYIEMSQQQHIEAQQYQQQQQLLQEQAQEQEAGAISLDPLAIARRAETAVRSFDEASGFNNTYETRQTISTPRTVKTTRTAKINRTNRTTKKTPKRSLKKKIGRLGGGPKRVGNTTKKGRGNLKSPSLRVPSSKKKHRNASSSKQRNLNFNKTTTTPRSRKSKNYHEKSSMFVEMDVTKNIRDDKDTYKEEVENVEAEEQQQQQEQQEQQEEEEEEEEENVEDQMDEQRRLYQMRLEQQLELELERQQYMMQDLERSLEDESQQTNMMMESPSANTNNLNQYQRRTETMSTSNMTTNNMYGRVAPPTPPRHRTNSDEVARTPSDAKSTTYGGLSHDSDAWREVMNSERRPRTAPPQGLDRESGIWSNTRSYLINESYMVGEAPPRPTTQRSGMSVSNDHICTLIIEHLDIWCLFLVFFSFCLISLFLFSLLFFFKIFLNLFINFFVCLQNKILYSFIQSRRKMRKTPMSDPVARYASHKQAWSRNIFLTSGSSRRRFTPRRSARSNSNTTSDTHRENHSVATTSGICSSPSMSKSTILKKKKKKYVVPTNKRRDDVRGNIRSKMKMVRMMEAQAGKRGGDRGASRAKQPSQFRIPSSKKRQALRWQIRGKMLSPA